MKKFTNKTTINKEVNGRTFLATLDYAIENSGQHSLNLSITETTNNRSLLISLTDITDLLHKPDIFSEEEERTIEESKKQILETIDYLIKVFIESDETKNKVVQMLDEIGK